MHLACVNGDTTACMDIVVPLSCNTIYGWIKQKLNRYWIICYYIRWIVVIFALFCLDDLSGHFSVIENNYVLSNRWKWRGGLPKPNNPLLMASSREHNIPWHNITARARQPARAGPRADVHIIRSPTRVHIPWRANYKQRLLIYKRRKLIHFRTTSEPHFPNGTIFI